MQRQKVSHTQHQQHHNPLPLNNALAHLAGFISTPQLDALTECLAGEESDFFQQKIAELSSLITSMPTTYQTDGQGQDAIVYLHYFIGEFDWYITEKDMLPEQLQAFGLVKMWETEFGYININELREGNVELDLYWETKPLKDILGGAQ